MEVWESSRQKDRANRGNNNGDRNNTRDESNNRKSVTVIHFYNPCNQLTVSDFDETMERVRWPVVWAGDFNAHNPLWGSERRDSNGAVIEKMLDG